MALIVASKYRVRIKIASSFIWEAVINAFPQSPNVRETVAAQVAIVMGRYMEGLANAEIEVESIEMMDEFGESGFQVITPRED